MWHRHTTYINIWPQVVSFVGAFAVIAIIVIFNVYNEIFAIFDVFKIG